MATKTYRYTGATFIPGLPHVINEVEAEAQGVRELLQDAIANGQYVEVEAIQSSGRSKAGRPSGAPSKDSEVDNG